MIKKAASLNDIIRRQKSQPKRIMELIEKHMQEYTANEMYSDCNETLAQHMMISNDVLSKEEHKQWSTLISHDSCQLTD